MHRRPIGRGRILAVLGALVVIVGCLLPWWQLGGQDLPLTGGNAFAGAGIVVFVIALATIAVVTMPYATDAPVGLDRWPTYALLAGAGLVGYGVRLTDLVLSNALRDGVLPDRAPGLWLTAIGLITLARAAYDVARERRER